MTEELKWKEEVAKTRRSKFLRCNNGDLHEEGFLIDCRIWIAQLSPYKLSIIEGDLYCYGRAETEVFPFLSDPFRIDVVGPDMESAKQALLVKLATEIEGQLKTLYGEITVEKQAQ